jgi:mRNA-degrading endonuclease toxin of MazEF toxin-antitoxin module
MISIAPTSTRVRGIQAEVRLAREDGFPQDCAVNLDSIQTIYKTLLTNRITTLSSEKMAAVDRAIKYALALK